MWLAPICVNSILASAIAAGAKFFPVGAPAEDATMTLTLGADDPVAGPMAKTFMPFDEAELTSLPSALVKEGSLWVAIFRSAVTSLPFRGTCCHPAGRAKENPY